MTSWITWEIWWSRVWGKAEPSARGEEWLEVAHEPSRLPTELLEQSRDERVR